MNGVEVFADRSPFRGDWVAMCDESCTRSLHVTTDNWPDAYEIAVGHASIYHPRRTA